MSENPRDTQFKGFAEKVLGEMLHASKTYSGLIDSESGAWQEAMQQIIARHAYDLVCHCFEQMNPIAPQACSTTEEMLEGIPDLTEWPDEGKKG
jgi:hypothetical protein